MKKTIFYALTLCLMGALSVASCSDKASEPTRTSLTGPGTPKQPNMDTKNTTTTDMKKSNAKTNQTGGVVIDRGYVVADRTHRDVASRAPEDRHKHHLHSAFLLRQHPWSVVATLRAPRRTRFGQRFELKSPTHHNHAVILVYRGAQI